MENSNNRQLNILDDESGSHGTGTSSAGFVTADKFGRSFICGTCEYFDGNCCGSKNVNKPESRKEILKTYPKLPTGEKRAVEDGKITVEAGECCSFHEFTKVYEKE